MTENGDELFLPTAGFSWNEAQAAAKSRAKEFGDDWSKAAYKSTKEVTLHIGCDWPDGCSDDWDHEYEPDYVPRHPKTRCYIFEVTE